MRMWQQHTLDRNIGDVLVRGQRSVECDTEVLDEDSCIGDMDRMNVVDSLTSTFSV